MLSNKNILDYGVYNFEPNASYGEAQLCAEATEHFDIPQNHETCSFGTPALSAGACEIGLRHVTATEDINLFDHIIKYPGETKHRIPKTLCPDLAPYFMRCASMEFAASPYAKDKIGVIMLRSATLLKNTYLPAANWHIHKFPTRSLIERTSEYARDLSDQDWSIMCSASNRMMADEFFSATTLGTEIQTTRATSTIIENAVDAGDALKTHDFPYSAPFEYRNIKPHETVIGTGAWHRSPRAEMKHDFQKRLLAVVVYLHTTDSYTKWKADQKKAATRPPADRIALQR